MTAGFRACVRSTRVRRVVIDNNGIDPSVDLPGAYEAARAAIDKGNPEIRYVHTTLTEAANIPDADRRDRVLLFLACLGKCAPSYGIVLDESRSIRPHSPTRLARRILEALASGNLGHENNRRDALVANTARANGWAVVTNESRRGSALRRSESRC